MLRKTVLVRALSIAFSAAALTAAVTVPAMAQSSASGNILGTVEAPAGATIQVTNTETGLKRSIGVESNGRYLITALPLGPYKVELIRNGKVDKSTDVFVISGQGADASFTTVATVQISGRRSRIDVSNTNNGANFTARELAKLPITPSLASIIQLAPNTTRGDTRYAAGDSFGGGGPSENAYYINGFPTTNPLTQLGASELPFGAIAQAQIITGGFGAEFGRSVGGVVNITTKSGTNNWEFGVQADITPDSLRSKSKNYMYGNTGANPTTDGKVRLFRENNTNDSKKLGAYIGGPIIKDKLFMFFAAETTQTDFSGTNVAFTSNPTVTNGWLESHANTDRYLAKLDWNINDNHRIEGTFVGDDSGATRETYGYNFLTNQRNNVLALKGHWSNDSTANGFTPSSGNEFKHVKYVGNLTEDLTLTVATGRSKVKHTNEFVLDKGLLPATGIASGGNPNPAVPIINPNPVNFNILPAGSSDTVKASRLDLEYKLGSHTIRGGLDKVELGSNNAGAETPGGATWLYLYTATPNTPISMSAGPRVATASGGQSGTNGYYVRKVVFSTSTSAASDQSSKYLEDRWQVTKNVLLTAGLRSESFSNRNGDNETFLEQKNELAPRLSGSWDVNGDASFKVFGSAGRYHVQIPTNVTVRGASRATNTQQFYTYSGIDPATGQPLGLVQLTGPRSANNELGQRKDPRTITSQNLKPSFQDEVTLGFEKVASPNLNFGVKGTYRTLQATADDFCDQTPFDEWAARNNVSTANWTYGLGCVILNPGEDQTFLVDFNNGVPALEGKNMTVVNMKASDLALPKPKRVYKAIDVFAEHPLRNGWYGKVNYTWSKSEGNTEGQTNSDTGQANVSITAVWDQKYLAEYADGLLPNHREHQVKAFGYYEVTPEVSLGGNFLAASGRPKSCLGIHPDPVAQDLGYGAAYHYCKNAAGVSVPAPRGTNGTYPWDIRLDMNVTYMPAMFKGLAFKVDVFNVTNRQTAQTIDDTHENGTGTLFNRYGGVLSYTTPRRARLSVEYNHKF